MVKICSWFTEFGAPLEQRPKCTIQIGGSHLVIDEEGNEMSVSDMTKLEEELNDALMHARSRKTQLLMEHISTSREQAFVGLYPGQSVWPDRLKNRALLDCFEYMSPEILGKGHDKAADWWSVGVLLFEMLTGQPPFRGGNREKIQQKIVKEKMKLPAYLSSEAHSLLKALLQKEPSNRLGSGEMGSDEVKRHKWFKPGHQLEEIGESRNPAKFSA
ncbi:hypothetical protein L2E82_25519 [Cichorium intybus]|uniref:Uncharacterized protein n=1 Tax=Cichorium intybus TaxID=13427 RepID=A0ACB9E3W8_CICIN|nr:hypothetical protein L2E82_25519 [Cichorium intybus]